MSFKLWMTNGNRFVDMSQMVGNVTWKSSTEELGQQMDVEMANSDMRFFPNNPIRVGSMLFLKKDDNEVLRTIVVDENKKGRESVSFKSFDAAFYLNKSTSVYQFNNESGDKAIRRVLNDFNIPIGKVVSIPTRIDEIYNGDSPSDLIKDILEQAESDQGIKYRMEMKQGKLFIEKQSDLFIDATFDMAANFTDYPVDKSISNPSRKKSIEKMKNSIVAVKDEKVVLTLANQNLINEYGLLQEVVDVQDKSSAEIRNMTNNKLNELAKVFEENALEMLGDYRVRAGRILNINEPVTGITGSYLVQSVSHDLSNGIHTMSLDVEGYNG